MFSWALVRLRINSVLLLLFFWLIWKERGRKWHSWRLLDICLDVFTRNCTHVRYNVCATGIWRCSLFVYKRWTSRRTAANGSHGEPFSTIRCTFPMRVVLLEVFESGMRVFVTTLGLRIVTGVLIDIASNISGESMLIRWVSLSELPIMEWWL